MRFLRAPGHGRGRKAGADGETDWKAAYEAVRSALEAAGRPEAAVPPELLSAASHPRHDGQAVMINVDGNKVIAVIGDEGGDPASWMDAIAAEVAS